MTWNRCDVCGRFIALSDFCNGLATRKLVSPDSEYSGEEWETLCEEHANASLRSSSPSETLSASSI
jgi:hypothetical protein